MSKPTTSGQGRAAQLLEYFHSLCKCPLLMDKLGYVQSGANRCSDLGTFLPDARSRPAPRTRTRRCVLRGTLGLTLAQDRSPCMCACRADSLERSSLNLGLLSTRIPEPKCQRPRRCVDEPDGLKGTKNSGLKLRGFPAVAFGGRGQLQPGVGGTNGNRMLLLRTS